MTGRSLARQHTAWLLVAFLAVECLTLALFAVLVMRPLAQRSANDLAGLLVLSAQTWAELPPATRPVFEEALRQQHDLRITRHRPPQQDAGDAWHPLFYYFLEAALAQRLGVQQHLHRVTDDQGDVGYWIPISTGSHELAVGLSAQRIASQPLLALGAVVGLALWMAIGLAVWSARRVVTPIAQLTQAAIRVGKGETPELLPEDGPLELAQLCRAFNQMALQVRDLVAARTLMLAGVSHDLRTPLARMRLALELMHTQPSTALLGRLERDIAQMNELIGNVLDLARGVSQEPAVSFDLGLFLEELARTHARPNRAVAVRFTANDAQPPLARLPQISLQRTLDNLLTNAMRYAGDGGVEVVCESTAQGWRIGVLDRGPGIPAHQIQAMFQPFQRLDASRSPTHGGHGLGLAIVKALADAHGWRISLTPRPEGGMAAWLEIPHPP